MSKITSVIISIVLISMGIGTAVMARQSDTWSIGPVIRGQNYSAGMPATMREGPGNPQFEFPYPDAGDGHVHYVTKRTGSLAKARSMTMRYRVEAAPGVRVLAREHSDREATVSLFFQRRGDNWSGRGPYETYRWYVVGAKMMPLTPGTHEITVDFADDWKGVGSSRSSRKRSAFRDALVNADRVGFVFGSAGGRGHGVFATGPARFVLLDFDIQ